MSSNWQYPTNAILSNDGQTGAWPERRSNAGLQEKTEICDSWWREANNTLGQSLEGCNRYCCPAYSLIHHHLAVQNSTWNDHHRNRITPTAPILDPIGSEAKYALSARLTLSWKSLARIHDAAYSICRCPLYYVNRDFVKHLNNDYRRITMWTKPAATEMRFGFEVTMYVCNR